MKKIIIANCAALFAFGICELSAFDYNSGSATETAESTEGSDWFFGSNGKESVVSTDKKAFKESADVCEYEKTGKEALEGWFAGVGLTQVASDNKATAIEHNYEWAGDVDYGVGGLMNPNDIVVAELLECGVAGDIQTIVAGDHLLGFHVNRVDNATLAHGKLSKLGGSVTFGYGRFMAGDIYLGGQFTTDFSANKDREDVAGRGIGNVSLKSHGVKPSLAVVFGVYSSAIDSLIYARFGTCYSSADFKSNYGNGKFAMLSPLAGLGIKKSVGGGLSFGCEFDYLFKRGKSVDLTRYVPALMNGGLARIVVTHRARAQAKCGGYAVRMLMMYNF